MNANDALLYGRKTEWAVFLNEMQLENKYNITKSIDYKYSYITFSIQMWL